MFLNLYLCKFLSLWPLKGQNLKTNICFAYRVSCRWMFHIFFHVMYSTHFTTFRFPINAYTFTVYLSVITNRVTDKSRNFRQNATDIIFSNLQNVGYAKQSGYKISIQFAFVKAASSAQIRRGYCKLSPTNYSRVPGTVPRLHVIICHEEDLPPLLFDNFAGHSVIIFYDVS